MKFVFGLLGLIVVLGLVYGLAFFGIIPVQQMANKSPALASVLMSLHLAKAKQQSKLAALAAAPDPKQQALDAQKKRLDADRAQLGKDRLDWEAKKQQADAPAADSGVALTDSAAKLSAIYATMGPDDLGRIFAKAPEADVISALTEMDEKKAGKVLAALPVDRAAQITRAMAHPIVASAGLTSSARLPRTSL